MTISGVALLAICTLLGGLLGDLLGVALGVKANVGGVGIAMMFLIAARLWLVRHGILQPRAQDRRRVLGQLLHSDRGRHGRGSRMWSPRQKAVRSSSLRGSERGRGVFRDGGLDSAGSGGVVVETMDEIEARGEAEGARCTCDPPLQVRGVIEMIT